MIATNITATVAGNPAYIPIVIAEFHNPETTIKKRLDSFLRKIDFATVFPNFGNIRVTNIHPFAMFLFQEISGIDYDFSLLPSICVADSSDYENIQFLGHEDEDVEITPSVWALLKQSIATTDIANALITSSTNVDRIDAALLVGTTIIGKKKTIISDHQIDLNIWSDNKEITGTLYDACKLFALNENTNLREDGIESLGSITGKRSGDINLDFGHILYGANVTLPCKLTMSVMEISLVDRPIIDEIIPEPTYHGGDND